MNLAGSWEHPEEGTEQALIEFPEVGNQDFFHSKKKAISCSLV